MGSSKKKSILSQIPPVNQILGHPKVEPLILRYSQELVVGIVQRETQLFKDRALKSKKLETVSRMSILADVADRVEASLRALSTPGLRRVINATGIILHTGLGRAPLTDKARKNIMQVAEGYCSLEIDLETGERGDRLKPVEKMLCQLTGAEAACVVNNNAAAVFLVLNTLCFGKEAVISRGQLVEIGGSFRIPEVMAKSGVKMVEVGTTNRTHLRDYENAISRKTGLLCSIHPSNYRVKGFTAEAGLRDLVKLGEESGRPVFQDLGGGVLIDLRNFGLPYEPVVQESVNCGVGVVSFSGDKVLGGPQAGIIVGKRKYVGEIKSNPLMRALRCDKLVFAALESTISLYFEERELTKQHRVLEMLLQPVAALEKRASTLLAKLSAEVHSNCRVEIEDTSVQMGSGALPLEELPSKAITLCSRSSSTEQLARKFRAHNPAIVGYVRDDKLVLDLRTVLEDEEDILINAINAVITGDR